MNRRRSGVMAPLFSLASTKSWGVGEYLDLPLFAEWLAAARQSFVQILPITEIPQADTSPYSALTAMALDPIHISLPALEDFAALGGESALGSRDRATLRRLRQGARVEHRAVRRLKERWLRRAFNHFRTSTLAPAAPRAARFAEFVRAESDWLGDHALFQALRQSRALTPWWEWPAPLARREPAALARAREDLHDQITFLQYVQWVAAEQWDQARLAAAPVEVFGDLPFMISADSSDVWMRPDEFRFDATVGVPPDTFSETGQDWGLPPWRWEVMAEGDFAWMRRRAARNAALFDGFRLDHLVGLYRTYIRPTDPAVEPFFSPGDEPTQGRLGEHLVRIYVDTGAEIIAEDLGTVPPFVRASLDRLGVPGFKVMRWERVWDAEDQPYIDPSQYPESSVATTGTHDTEPLVCWWDELAPAERLEVLQIPSVASRTAPHGDADALAQGELPSPVLKALLGALLDAPSRLVIFPIQDAFGWPARINTPALVDAMNWTWRLPIPVDRLGSSEEASFRAAALASMTAEAGR
ncbi:MAG: 4-alpha-glucanotransferase [Acidobacteriota bacterium]